MTTREEALEATVETMVTGILNRLVDLPGGLEFFKAQPEDIDWYKALGGREVCADTMLTAEERGYVCVRKEPTWDMLACALVECPKELGYERRPYKAPVDSYTAMISHPDARLLPPESEE